MSDGQDAGAGAGAGAGDGGQGGGNGGGVADALSRAAAGTTAGGAGGEQPGAGGEGGGDPAGGARWQDKFLPEDMRGDETLATYKDVPDVARALIETKKWARGRIAVPGQESDEGFADRFGEFVSKVRPESADAYTLADSDGKPTPLTDAMRPILFEAGLHPHQAKIVTEGWNQVQADLSSRMQQEAANELTAIEVEMGPAAYNQRLAAVNGLFASMGFDGDRVQAIAAGLTQAAGAGDTMRGLFELAEKTGELAKIDGAQVRMQMGTMSPDDAQKELDAQNSNTDPDFQKRLADPTSAEHAKRKQLMQVVARRGR